MLPSIEGDVTQEFAELADAEAFHGAGILTKRKPLLGQSPCFNELLVLDQF